MFSIAGTAGTGSSTSAAQPDTGPVTQADALDSEEAAAATSPTGSQYGAEYSAIAVPTTPKDDVPNVLESIRVQAVTLSSPLTTLLAAQYANAAEHMLLGKLQGRNQPSARELSSWCTKHLHSTFLHMTFLGQGYFEVVFSSPEGKQDTLRRSGFFFGEHQEVVFSPWQPSFEPEDPVCVDTFAYGIWAQFCGLNSLLRTKQCLTEIAKHIGVVLAVEEDDTNRATIAGLRVRISVPTKDLKTLPKRITIPQIGHYTGKTCKVVYSGLPDQCLTCNTYAHSPKNCPTHTSSVDHYTDHSLVDTRAGNYSKQKGKGSTSIKASKLQRPDERIVFQQANLSVLENLEDHSTRSDWIDHHKQQQLSNKGPVNSQFTMTLSGPLSAPHSPPHVSQEVAVSRWASSCAGISPMSTKFSSRPAHAM